ncbi:MAG: hypothetical protein QOE70_4003 [Chthoniobacter sp.]|nr:hypothetical protein [Chthoniobacter sp.]
MPVTSKRNPSPHPPGGKAPLGGLLRRRQMLVPTLRGWLALVLLLATLITVLVLNVHSFLAVNDSLPGEVLVLEGWAPDYTCAEALAEFRRSPYRALCVTGGPLEEGAPLAAYETFAELGAAILEKMGCDPKILHRVPAPLVRQDRTYTSALFLKDYLRDHGLPAQRINVMSQGVHSRRTRLLFQKAFGPACSVGIIAVEDRSYDARHWWKSSQGVRSVIDETVAYVYARFLFKPGQP